MDGIGSVITSSPTSFSSGRPSSLHDSTDAPRQRAWSSPEYTGSSGQPPTKAVHRSVPPLVENSHTSGKRSYTQSKPSTGSGEPVEPTARSPSHGTGRTSAFIDAPMNPALVPKVVTRASAANSHSRFGSGCPSYRTIVAPASNPPTRKFHIIQPVVVNQKKRSPGDRSEWSRAFFRCSSRIPPWPCTIAFGSPVVPDE